jgi:hypothetical protein
MGQSQFTTQTLRGDAEIVARVTAARNTNRFAKAGFMMRQNRDAASPHVILDVNSDGGIEFMTRSSSGTSTTFPYGIEHYVPGMAEADACRVEFMTRWDRMGSRKPAMPLIDHLTYGAVAISQQPTWSRVIRKRVDDLLRRPACSRMLGGILIEY